MSYTLRHTWPDRPDDYVFRHNGVDVGRCYRTDVPDGVRWLWTIYGRADRGLALSLEEAKAQFRQAFERTA
jgi:hypothetical protein